MPAMLRTSNKCKKIAYSILGEPNNLQDKKSSWQRKIDKAVSFQNSQRVK